MIDSYATNHMNNMHPATAVFILFVIACPFVLIHSNNVTSAKRYNAMQCVRFSDTHADAKSCVFGVD